MTDANPWAWWEQALATPKLIGIAPSLQIHDGDPQQGFYKTRWKGKNWEPVAIWREEDTWFALRNGRGVDANEIWTWVCRFPVTSEAYDRAMAGGGWEDDDPSVAAALNRGHNAGDVDEFDLLKDEIDSAEIGADAYKGINSEEQAGRAQSLRARMNELSGQADKLRETAKKPHWDAGQAVDKKWMPLVKSAKAVADTIRRELENYQTRKLQEQRRLEREREEEVQRRQREEARLQAEIAAAAEAGRVPVVPPAPAPLPELKPVVADTIKGNYGRAASVGTETVVTGITDQDALYRYCVAHPDLTACLLKIAQSYVRAGQTVPGITTEERAKIS